MRLISLLALAGTAAAVDSLVVQGYDGDNNRILKYATEIPVCANLCIFQASIAVGCNPDDYHCQCSSKRLQLYTLTESCLAKSCTTGQAYHAHRLTDEICNAVAEGVRNPVFRPPQSKEAVPAPAPAVVENVVFPDAPIPDGVVFPDAPIPAAPPAPAAPLMRRDVPAEPQAAPVEKRATASFAASSIPSTAATATSSPSTVATAGAAPHKAPSIIAGVGAIAAAALMI